MDAWSVGTMVDEAIMHLIWNKKRIAREWFFVGDPEQGQIPSFLPMGIEAARRALGTEYLGPRSALGRRPMHIA